MNGKQVICIFVVLIVLSCFCISVVSAHRMHVVHKIVVVNATHMPGHRGETTINLSQDVAEAGGTSAEMPLYSRIIAGFGYLIGIAGVAMAYMGWKQKKKYERGDKEQ